MKKQVVSIFWFRRDLRLDDNTALNHALRSGTPVLPLFIFDNDILKGLPADDARVSFIHHRLRKIHSELNQHGSSLRVETGSPVGVWEKLLGEFSISAVYVNRDYEPASCRRDQQIESLLRDRNIPFYSFKDQVLFETDEVLKNDGSPYTMFTPYKNKWLEYRSMLRAVPENLPEPTNLYGFRSPLTELKDLDFTPSAIQVPDYDLSVIPEYEKTRDYPFMQGTSRLGPHLRFGTVSIRRIVDGIGPGGNIFLSELIWREFFMQILSKFPRVVHSPFRQKYSRIPWRNNKEDFDRWRLGITGYPLVDAGMRQLNRTGFMHNRVRMVAASFLCKHLLIDWRWGEAYFAEKLLDYEQSSNNGNWQWAAGTGCDAAPYFRVFNPDTQRKKFDPGHEYIRKWVEEFGTPEYPDPMVEHRSARERAIRVYRDAVNL